VFFAGWRLRLTRPTDTVRCCRFVAPVSAAPPGNTGARELDNNEGFVFMMKEVMMVGEGLLGALRLALRVVACGNAFSLRSNRTLVEASHPSLHRKNIEHGANMRF